MPTPTPRPPEGAHDNPTTPDGATPRLKAKRRLGPSRALADGHPLAAGAIESAAAEGSAAELDAVFAKQRADVEHLAHWLARHVHDVEAMRRALLSGDADAIRALPDASLHKAAALALVGVNRCLLDDYRLRLLDLPPNTIASLVLDDAGGVEVVRVDRTPRVMVQVTRLEAGPYDDDATLEVDAALLGPDPRTLRDASEGESEVADG